MSLTRHQKRLSCSDYTSIFNAKYPVFSKSLPTHSKSTKLLFMRKLTAALCLTFAVLFGSVGVSASADFEKGLTAFKSGDYETALREWKPLAEQGHAKSQFNLGVMYQKGQGVPKNYKTAVKWYRLAAKQGHALSQGKLSAMYALGQGVIKNRVYAHM